MRYSVVGVFGGCCWLPLAGCATNGALQVPTATGNVSLYDGGGQPIEWPAQHVHWNDPATSLRGPFSKQLWDLGHRTPTYHCFYLRDDGSPTRVTLMGLVKATVEKNGQGLFGGHFSQQDVEVSARDGSRIEARMVESFMRETQGDPGRLQALLNESLAHDVKCLRLLLQDYQTRADLNEQGKALAADKDGRQVVIGIDRDRGYYRKYLYWLGQHETEVRELRLIYEKIAMQLNNRVARAAPPIATLPNRAPRPDYSSSTVVAARPVTAPRLERISVDTTPLRDHERETAEKIKTLKASCTLYARIDCGA